MPLAPSYRRVCVRSSHETDRPPLRGSKPQNPRRELSLGLEASRRSDSASHLPPPYWNKKLKGAKRRPARKQLRSGKLSSGFPCSPNQLAPPSGLEVNWKRRSTSTQRLLLNLKNLLTIYSVKFYVSTVNLFEIHLYKKQIKRLCECWRAEIIRTH